MQRIRLVMQHSFSNHIMVIPYELKLHFSSRCLLANIHEICSSTESHINDADKYVLASLGINSTVHENGSIPVTGWTANHHKFILAL
mmetsp:Transcript_6230/g.9150  ORF Transcript_6230/g.9150 Transcript_6230/m.9150 type:complete len:87 (-) Transcript_6230:237-497(-)